MQPPGLRGGRGRLVGAVTNYSRPPQQIPVDSRGAGILPAASAGGTPAPQGDSSRRPKVSLCMIVPNEEANLPAPLGQMLPAVRRPGGAVRWTDVVINHSGYQDPALRRRKLQRDLRLLLLEDAARLNPRSGP